MKLAVINTGGTISCVGDPLAPMTAAAFAQACRAHLDDLVRQAFPQVEIDYIVDLPFPESTSRTLDSTNLQPRDWCLMAGYILDHYEAYDAWVVLHGTDSMDFTGGALPFLLSAFDAQGRPIATLSKPVILTGSQVPMFHQANGTSALTLNFNTDAYQNFCGAVAAAQTGVPEVCVYFDSQLFRGARVLKTDANQFNAFSSPNYPALGKMGISMQLDDAAIQPGPLHRGVSLDDRGVRGRARARLAAIAAGIDNVPVMPFCAFPAAYDAAGGSAVIGRLLDACVAQGVRGLVLQSYGEGNFPSGHPDHPEQGAIYQALARAHAAGVLMVDCTQVLRGTVNATAYASGAWLPSVGALNPADMTPMAAFGKLMVLLAAAAHDGHGPDDLRRLMQLNLLGEMRSVSRLDSRTNRRLRPGESISTLDGSARLLNDPAQGPVLTTSTGQTCWTAWRPGPDEHPDLPGEITVEDDGRLIYTDRNQACLWSIGTAGADRGGAWLDLSGSAVIGDLSLSLVTVQDGLRCTIFPPTSADQT